MNAPLRVGLLASTLGGGGGMGRFGRELLRELGKRTDVELVVVVPPGTEPIVDELRATNVAEVLPIRGRGQVDRAIWERYRLGSVLEGYGVDVVHGTKHLVPRTPLPTVLTVQDVMTVTWPQQFKLAKRLLLPRQFRASLCSATILVAASKATADRLALLDPSFPAKTVLAPNGISVELLSVEPRRPPVVPEGVFALVVGDLSPRKNVSLLIDIWPDVAEATGGMSLVAVGPDGWRSAGTRRRLAALEARGLAHWARHVPDEELRWWYEHAAMVLVPSHEEGYGLPVIEALALGATVIASTDPALTEVAQGRALHLPPDDADAWTDAILTASRRPPAHQPPPVLATWSDHAALTVEAYRLALERSRR